MSDYLNEMFDGLEEISSNASSLECLSRAFYTTGNEVIGYKLQRISNVLKTVSENMRNSLSKEYGRQFKVATDASSNMVMAALSACMDKSDDDNGEKDGR